MRYFCNCLFDSDEFWHGDASGAPRRCRPLTCTEIKQSKMAARHHLENGKMQYLLNCVTDFDEFWYDGAFGNSTTRRPLRLTESQNPRRRPVLYNVHLYKTYDNCTSRCLRREKSRERSRRLSCSMQSSNRTDYSRRSSSHTDLQRQRHKS